jgi:hypothetical protein
MRVKQKTYTIKKGSSEYRIQQGTYTTSYDEQGRIAAYSSPGYVQSFTYYKDSIIAKGTDLYSTGTSTYAKFDANKNLLKFESSEALLCERVFDKGKLIYSRQVDNISGKALERYTLRYFTGTEKLQTIDVGGSGSIIYTYDDESPGQLANINGKPVIYNLKGKMIDYNGYKFNYDEEGLLKSFTEPEGSMLGPSQCNFGYDNRGRLISIQSRYLLAQYSYHDNGLIEKMGDSKVKYTYY